MNELIKTIFTGFTVDGKPIPVSYMFYEGHGEPYVTYMNVEMNNSLSGDNELLGYIAYYDFDVYSKGNYTKIIESIKTLLKQNGFVFQPSRCSEDMYETDTGYFHKTLNFAYIISEVENGENRT